MESEKVRTGALWVGISVGAIAVFILLSSGMMLVYAKMYEGQMFPGVRVLGVVLDGRTPIEARKLVQEAIDRSLRLGLRFSYHGQDVRLDPAAGASDPDTSRDLIQFSIENALDQAFYVGRSGSWLHRAVSQWRVQVLSQNFVPKITLDRRAIQESLHEALAAQLTFAQDAHFGVTASASSSKVVLIPEQKGVELIVDPALNELERQAKRLAFTPIPLSDIAVSPKMTSAVLAPFLEQADQLVAHSKLTFTHESSKFFVPTTTLTDWLTVTTTLEGSRLTLDPLRFADDISSLAPGVEREAKNGSLVIKDGTIDSFVSGVQGVEIDATSTLQNVLANWPASITFPIVVTIVDSTLTGEDPERLGIRELLGVGRSNFSGSPVNRRKNIAHGADQVNGSIIQPGETFSLLTTLGPVDGEHKWLPELVIKGNETKPEFGGGLCQIGTTTFRGALASGLPIVERQNHSYRVRYYEPAGTDATIYDPKPDFRFLNDTEHAVLINASIVGDEAIFEFWGTKDGRKVEQTKSRIYNITAPPAMKLIETLDLEPGKKKCTETAHPGADAEFTYTVSYPNEEVKTEVFRSHYRPWQAVCLIGVEKLSTSAATSTNSTTTPLVP